MADFSDGGFCPDIPATTESKWRLQIAVFGDGYQQRTLDGANALDRAWSLSFSNKPKYLIEQMDAYLTAAGAGPFAFRNPATGELVAVICDEWSIEWNLKRYATDELFGSLRAEFSRFNGLWLAAS